MRGDANIDFVISIVLFLSFIVFIIIVMNTIVEPMGASQDDLLYQGKLVSGMLLNHFSYNGRLNILDQEKLESVVFCSDVDIPTTSDFYYVVDTKAKTWSCTPDINISSGMPFVQRPVYVKLRNGMETPGVMKVWTWPRVT